MITFILFIWNYINLQIVNCIVIVLGIEYHSPYRLPGRTPNVRKSPYTSSMKMVRMREPACKAVPAIPTTRGPNRLTTGPRNSPTGMLNSFSIELQQFKSFTSCGK